jgi:hypothetical protein
MALSNIPKNEAEVQAQMLTVLRQIASELQHIKSELSRICTALNTIGGRIGH